MIVALCSYREHEKSNIHSAGTLLALAGEESVSLFRRRAMTFLYEREREKLIRMNSGCSRSTAITNAKDNDTSVAERRSSRSTRER